MVEGLLGFTGILARCRRGMPVQPIISILAVNPIVRLLPRIWCPVKSNSNLFDTLGGDIRLRAT